MQNGTSVGPLRALLDKDADISISGWWLNSIRLQFFDVTNSHLSESVIFVVPPGSPLTSFEKIVYPFSRSLWFWVIASLLVGLVVIFILKFRSKTAQNFVFGVGVKTPYLNMLIGFIGEPQNILPRTNFARFLLMTFLMYSLVMRTLYQGSFFNLVQSNKRHEEVQTFNEMIENKFHFYVAKGIASMFSEAEQIKNK